MNSHVSAILLGVKDMERSKRFYMDGLGWKVASDYKISVFFVPHGGSLVGFYGRAGLADAAGAGEAVYGGDRDRGSRCGHPPGHDQLPACPGRRDGHRRGFFPLSRPISPSPRSC